MAGEDTPRDARPDNQTIALARIDAPGPTLLRVLRLLLADRHVRAPVRVVVPGPSEEVPAAIWAAAREVMRSAGFALVDADERRSSCPPGRLRHRHVAVVVRHARDRLWGRQLMTALAAASPRAHVLIEGGASMTDAPATWRPARARGAGQRRIFMSSESQLASLVRIVQEAEDERDALTGLCRWLCREGVASAALIADSDGAVVCREGWREGTGGIAERVRAGVACHERVGGYMLAVEPIRQHGVVMGAAVARWAAERADHGSHWLPAVAALAPGPLRARLDALAAMRDPDRRLPEILGRSPALADVRHHVIRAAATVFPVLIHGESGTGKELVARAIHRLSARRERRFAAINCAALTDDLVEAELFGHARGAFTGAVAPRAGLFEEASSGTLFLDEVGELSPRAQAKLLRALQEREIRRVGENHARPVDVRVVSATNRDLGAAVAHGMFREDLLFRLAVIRLRLPPLRERVEDIPTLAQAFWKPAAAAAQTRAVLAPDALMTLSRHTWPGNVRELQNVVSALAVAAPAQGRVGSRHVSLVLGADLTAASAARSLDAARQSFERSAVAAALARHGGRRTAAARELGLSRQGLIKAIKRLGLDQDNDARGVA